MSETASRRGTRWTDEEDNELMKQVYDGMNLNEIAQIEMKSKTYITSDTNLSQQFMTILVEIRDYLKIIAEK